MSANDLIIIAWAMSIIYTIFAAALWHDFKMLGGPVDHKWRDILIAVFWLPLILYSVTIADFVAWIKLRYKVRAAKKARTK